jgi:hypothetical protein
MTFEVDGLLDARPVHGGHNHSLKRHLPVCCSCSKSAAENPLWLQSSAARSSPVPPVLSGRDQAPPNSLIENP